MASDKPKSPRELLDRLYPDDPTSARPAPDAAAAPPDEDAELASYARMLARIRREELAEEVPASIHEAVMAAAAKELDARAEQPTTGIESPISGAPALNNPRQTPEHLARTALWAGFNRRSIGQFALVAAVMVTAGFLFIKFSAEPEPKFSTANQPVEEQVAFDAPAPSESRQSAPAVVAKSEAPNEASNEVSNTKVANQQDEAELAAEDHQLDEEDHQLDGKEVAIAEPSPSRAPSSSGRALAKEPTGSTAPRSAPVKKRAAPAPMAKKSAAAPAKKDNYNFESADETVAAEKTSPARSALDAIEESYTNGHFNDTHARADALLADAGASSPERAGALEYKARAYNAQDRRGDALDIYEKLRADYPDYRPSQIDAEIARLRGLEDSAPRFNRMRDPGRSPAKPPRPAPTPSSSSPNY